MLLAHDQGVFNQDTSWIEGCSRGCSSGSPFNSWTLGNNWSQFYTEHRSRLNHRTDKPNLRQIRPSNWHNNQLYKHTQASQTERYKLKRNVRWHHIKSCMYFKISFRTNQHLITTVLGKYCIQLQISTSWVQHTSRHKLGGENFTHSHWHCCFLHIRHFRIWKCTHQTFQPQVQTQFLVN